MNKKFTFPITKDMVTLKNNARVSTESAQIVCKILNRTKFTFAKSFVDGLLLQKKNIKGKYYTRVSEAISEVLKGLENNATSRDFNPDEMMLFISAHKGRKLMRGRRKRRFGLQIKNTNLQAVLKKSEVKKQVAKKETKVEKK